MQRQKKNKGIDWYSVIIQCCTMITCVMFPLLLFKNEIQLLETWLQPITILVFGIGGIGLYIVLGSIVEREMRNW